MGVVYDMNGVRLADVPNAGVAKIDPNAKSGNPSHDTASGKFGSTGKKENKNAPPPNTSPQDFSRMMDAIREAAREFDNPDVGDIKQFIAGRAKSPDQVDVAAFLDAVKQQRLNDLVDMLDQQLRSSGPLKLGRRKVRVFAPRGYIRKYLKSVDSPQVAEISLRLTAMGHSEADVTSFFNNKFPGSEAEIKKAKKAKLAEQSNWAATDLFFADNEEDPFPFGPEWEGYEEPKKEVDPVEMAEKIASKLPQPVINVTVEAPKSGKKIVQRDPATGLIQSIEDMEETLEEIKDASSS